MAHTFHYDLSDTSPAAASTVVGVKAVGGLHKHNAIRVDATLTGATGGVLDVYLQTSHDEGATWNDFAHFAQVAAGASAATYSFTAARSQPGTSILTTGTGTSPALAANAFVPGEFGDRLRVLFVAGASTSAGAAQSITVSGTIGYGSA
jgi:hypothetical protein